MLDGIAAVGELALQLIGLFFSGFANLSRALRRDAGLAERRKDALLASIKLGVPMAVATSLMAYIAWYEIKTYWTRQTQQIVQQHADWLDSQKGLDGTYRQVDPGRLDAWGTPLRVTWAQHDLGESMIVVSAGEDKLLETQDDIATTRINLQAKSIAKNVGREILRELRKK